jgi:TonB family protein
MLTSSWLRRVFVLALVILGAAPEASAIDLESLAQRLLSHLGAKEAPCPPEAKSLTLSRFLVCGQLQVDQVKTAKEIDRALVRRKELGVAAHPTTKWSNAGHSRSRYYVVEGSVFGVTYDWSSSAIVVSYPRPFRRCETSRAELQTAVDACTQAHPKKVAGSHPEYPESARLSKIDGHVELGVIIDVDGLIRDACALKGTGDGAFGFEQTSIEALGTWRYEPARRDGQPVECTMIITTDFTVRDVFP